MASPLFELARKAVALEDEIRALDGNSKLSAAAFLAKALDHAKCDRKRLKGISKALAVDPEAEPTRAFIHSAERWLSEPTCPEPPPPEKFSKMIFVLGTENTRTDLARLGVSVGEAIALAALWATKRWPEKFGQIEDRTAHFAKADELRAQLASTLGQMTFTAADLDLDANGAKIRGTDVRLVKGWEVGFLAHVRGSGAAPKQKAA